jgi:hypothetical protein
MDDVAGAIFLAVFVKAALDRIADMIRSAIGQPEADIPWLALVAFGVGGCIAYLLGLNVFGVIANELVGRILTAVAVGGGIEFLNSMLAQVQNRNGEQAVRSGRAIAAGRVLRVRGW